MASIVILAGSPSAVSRTTALARQVGDELTTDGHDVRLVVLRDLPPDALLTATTADPTIAHAIRTVLEADAVVVATPVYKASYSGLLKAFLDLLPQSALLGKVVLPLATGGTIAHLLVIDYSLRPVLVSLGAGHITPGRFVLDVHIDHRSGGPVITDETTRDCLDRTVSTFRAALGDLDVTATRPLTGAPA